MVEDDLIRAVERIETPYQEKAVLDSPFEAKEFINALPWNTLAEEEQEHGSLRAKLEERGVDDTAIDAAEDFGFSDGFAAHPTWDPNALGHDEGAWTIDADSFDEAAEFFEFVGYRVEVANGVEL